MDVHIVDDVCDDNKRNWALQLEFTYPVSQSVWYCKRESWRQFYIWIFTHVWLSYQQNALYLYTTQFEVPTSIKQYIWSQKICEWC